VSQDDILKMAQQCGDWNGQTIEMNDVGLERFAALIEQHLSFDSIHTCHDECQRPACAVVRKAVQAERDRATALRAAIEQKPVLWYHPLSGRVRFEETPNWIPLYK
jgi:hypothetical protein